MQNPSPGAGTMPAADPSSWEMGLGGRLVPKSTESNNRRRNNAPVSLVPRYFVQDMSVRLFTDMRNVQQKEDQVRA